MENTDTALDAAKKIKEIEKLELEIRDHEKNIGLAKLQGWASLLVPVMSAITVISTVYLGFEQISSKRASDEDQRWKDTITAIAVAKNDSESSTYLATLLPPFLLSTRYRTLAVGVTVAQLPRIREPGTFGKLFKEAFSESDIKDLSGILNVNKQLSVALNKTQDATGHWSTTVGDSNERGILLAELKVTCEPLAEIFQKLNRRQISAYPAGDKDSSGRILLGGAWFEQCDFSNIDFSYVNLDNASFDQVKLDGSVLNNLEIGTPGYIWAAEVWWRAKSINRDQLKLLINSFKPYQPFQDFRIEYRNAEKISGKEWATELTRLCDGAGLKCLQKSSDPWDWTYQ